MNSRFSYTLLGLFVIGLGAALVAGILWLSTGGLIRPDYQRYLVYTQESVTGLSVDSRVTYKGVDVGQVAEMAISRNRPDVVRLVLEIREDTPISEDTVARLEMQGLTGLSTINLSGSSADSPPLEKAPGEPYPVIPSKPSLYGQLDDVVNTLVETISETAERINRLLSDDNRRRFENTLAHMERISGEYAERSERLGQAVEDLAGALGNVRTASAEVPELIERFQATATAVEKMAREIERAGSTVRQQAASSGDMLERFEASTLPATRATLEALRAAAGNLRRMSEELQRDPSVLLYGSPPRRPGPGE